LPWLALYGYRNLHGNNIAQTRKIQVGPIAYAPGDVMKTGFADATLAAVTCLSVIEHGVDVETYLREMSRILRPGGVLITSTDYWADGVDTAGLTAYGVPVRIFDRGAIENFLETARSVGLHPTSDVDLSCDQRAVHWKRLGLDFTFLLLTLEK